MTDNERPRPLTDGYRQARKAYGIAAGLLLAWELIGIELASDPVGPVPVKLESPEAAPLVLLALVLYFGVRLTIEWYQCHAARRQTVPAKLDFSLAHLIGASALLAFVIQRVIETQLYDLLEPRLAPGAVGVTTAVATMNALIYWVDNVDEMRKPAAAAGVVATLILLVNWGLDIAPFLVQLLWGLGGIVLGGIIYLSVKFRLFDHFLPSIFGADLLTDLLLDQLRSIREEKT